jgi:acyl-CoA thioester hydrolase
MDSVTLETDFPIIFETPVAWGEMDSLGHVNNIVYFRYFESARLAYFERVGFLDEMKRTGIGPILATTKCRFRMPLTYPDSIRIGATAHDLQADRFTMTYCIESQALDAIAADGEGLIVAYDYNQKRKAPLPESVRGAILELEAD